MQPTPSKVAARANLKHNRSLKAKEQDPRRLILTTTTVYQQYMLISISKVS